MEKEELNQEQATMEEQETDEMTPLVRKSRNGDDSKIAAVSAVNGEVSNGVSESNGQGSHLENGAENEEMIIPSVEEESNGVIENEEETRYVLERETEIFNGEQKNEENETGFIHGEHKNEESEGVLENVLEFINREHKIEEIHGVLENELNIINREDHKIEEIHGVLENELNFINREEHKIEEIHGALENEIAFINREHKIEEIHGVLENESEFINGEHKIDETHGALENEIVFINREHKIEEINGVSENELNFINEEHKIEEIQGALENEIVFINTEHKIKEIHGVLENESEFINGEKKIEESVPVLQIVTGAINKELKLENLVFHDKDEGVKSTSTHIVEEEEHILKGPALIKSGVSEINDTRVEEIEENGISGLNHEHSDSSFEGGEASHYEPSKEIESEEIDLINEDDLEITEFDVERVIKKQTTHDLYCPNCKSCITKRVILHKRKRRIRTPDEDVKRNKTGSTVGSELGAVSTQSPEDQVHQEDEGDIDDAQEPAIDREPDIFRCLSCFRFFIPTGNGFKLFKQNWFTNIFGPNKHVTAVEQGSSSQTNAKHVYTAIPSSDSADQSSSSAHPSEGLERTSGINITLESRDTSLRFPNLKPSANGITIGIGGKSDMKATEAVEETTGMNITLETRDTALRFPNLKPSVNGNVTIGVGGNLYMKATEAADATIQQFDVFGMDQPKESKLIQEVHTNQDIDLSVATHPMKTQVTNVESAEDNISFPQQNGLKLLITPNKGSPILQNIEEGVKTNQAVQTGDNEAIQLSPPSASVIQASDVDGKLNITVSIPHEEQDVTATIVTKSVFENKNVDSRSRDGGEVYPPEVPQQIVTETKIEVHPNEPIKTEFSSALLDTPVAKSNDTVITIDRQLPASTHIAEDIILPAAVATASQSEAQVSTADRGERKIEVIKSIVYGGLAESITSLSVVSSAAGGDAATLNVLVLGAANLIGGLFVIAHNLWDLRCDRDEQVSNQITEQKDRYRELLGRRQNFLLHAVVAIISYIIFGLVSPVVYGFSFRVSDDKQMKLVVTAAASLLCILILAVAKAYVQRPPKPYLKTVLNFVILGFMVSGVSFAAGALVERLMEKLGLFEANSVAPNLLMQERTPVGSGWASY